MKLYEIKNTEREKNNNVKSSVETDDSPDLDVFRKAFNDQFEKNDIKTDSLLTTTKQAGTPALKKASRASTQAKVAQVQQHPDTARKLSFLQSLGIEDSISDEEARRRAGVSADTGYDDVKPPSTDLAVIQKMPAIVNKEIATGSGVEPEWHQVKHLPGYLSSGIRAMGRQVFSTYTKTPIEDIQVLANLGNSNAPNSTQEMNAVLGWLRDNATRDTEGEMNFKKTIPDYEAEFKIFNNKEFTFMVVQDFAGRYIYSWPTSDEIKSAPNSTTRISKQTPRITR